VLLIQCPLCEGFSFFSMHQALVSHHSQLESNHSEQSLGAVGKAESANCCCCTTQGSFNNYRKMPHIKYSFMWISHGRTPGGNLVNTWPVFHINLPSWWELELNSNSSSLYIFENYPPPRWSWTSPSKSVSLCRSNSSYRGRQQPLPSTGFRSTARRKLSSCRSS